MLIWPAMRSFHRLSMPIALITQPRPRYWHFRMTYFKLLVGDMAVSFSFSICAFDTIDHEILLDRISSHCGIDGKPLAWIASYLRNRTQSVIVDGAESDPVQVKYGVPQGFVLGPKLYTIYVNCLRLVAERYGISIEQYSDDTVI